jgi:casein kinase II subunit alpha
MGFADLKDFLNKYKPAFESFPMDKINDKQKKHFTSFVNKENKHLCDKNAIDLLEKMLVFDHSLRITAKEAMEHPYFDNVRNSLI